MDAKTLTEFSEIVDWLFQYAPPDWTAQVGYANAAKRALVWLPGRKAAFRYLDPEAPVVALAGCTQLAFPPNTTTYDGDTEAALCWVGVDIDASGNPECLDVRVAPVAKFYSYSMRMSSSGKGVHLIARLDPPIRCKVSEATGYIKAIAEPVINALGSVKVGVAVDKADRRMFWLVGGKQEWVYRTPDTHAIPVMETPEAVALDPDTPIPIPPILSDWIQEREPLSTATLTRLVELERAAETPLHPGSNRVYVGTIVKALRSLGEVVNTRSPMSGNGQVNGYVDVGEYSIRLWSYADGCTIWEWVDVAGVVGG